MGLTNLACCFARVTICALTAFAWVPVAAADDFPKFRIKQLNTLGEERSVGTAINDAGQATGYVGPAQFSSLGPSTRAFLFSNGKMTKLGTLGGLHSWGIDINAAGQVVGTSWSEEWNYDNEYQIPHAFLYSNGEMTDLMKNIPYAEHAYGAAINVHGQVAFADVTEEGDGYTWLVSDGDFRTRVYVADGYSITVRGLNDAGYVIGSRYIWTSPDDPCGCRRAYVGKNYDELIELGSLGVDLSSIATAINNAGQITGNSGTVIIDPDRSWEDSPHAFLYSGGSMKDLGTLGGMTSGGLAINERGKITGVADTSSGNEHAFLWDGVAMRDLGTLGGTTSRGQAINRRWATGTSDVAGDADTHAFVSDGGPMVDLHNLIDPADPLKAHVTLRSAVDINYPGQILVNGLDKRTNKHHAFIVSPMEYQVSFIAPAAGARPKAGTTTQVKVALVDNAGKRISDARALSLVGSPCQVKFSARGAQSRSATCMKYNATSNEFFFNWKLNATATGSANIEVAATYQFSVPALVTAKQSQQIRIVR